MLWLGVLWFEKKISITVYASLNNFQMQNVNFVLCSTEKQLHWKKKINNINFNVLLYFGRSSSWWVFFIEDLHLKFQYFLGFQHRSGSSVKTITLLLPLVIGLKCFCFLTALLLHLNSTILELSFLDLKDLCLPNQFSRAS